jgi:putative hydrolase of HD superfamily
MLHNTHDCIARIETLGIQEPYKPLQKLERTGWIIRNIPNPETVAEHSINAALLVWYFNKKIQDLGLNSWLIQDALLIHDIAEWDPNVWDITPLCGISEEEKREKEEKAAREILANHPTLLNLWLDYADKRTPEWIFAKEIDKLQAIEQARFYEDTYKVSWLTEEFFMWSVIQRKQITTDFLYRRAVELHENKPR